jgi:hypothetical protein
VACYVDKAKRDTFSHKANEENEEKTGNGLLSLFPSLPSVDDTAMALAGGEWGTAVLAAYGEMNAVSRNSIPQLFNFSTVPELLNSLGSSDY